MLVSHLEILKLLLPYSLSNGLWLPEASAQVFLEGMATDGLKPYGAGVAMNPSPRPRIGFCRELMWPRDHLPPGHGCLLSILGRLAWPVASGEQPSSSRIDPSNLNLSTSISTYPRSQFGDLEEYLLVVDMRKVQSKVGGRNRRQLPSLNYSLALHCSCLP